jgi:hypothetical protein
MTWAVISQTMYQLLIDKIWNMTWLNIYWSAIFLFIVAVYAVLVILLYSIHTLIKKYYKNNEQKFFLECDKIISKFAKEQYIGKYQNNINIYLMEWIFQSDTKNYFLEKNTFETKVKETENNIWKTIIDKYQWWVFYKYYNKTKTSKIVSEIIWWILTIITIWIYKLFI